MLSANCITWTDCDKKRSFATLSCEKFRKDAAAIYILQMTLFISSFYPKDELSRDSSVRVATRYGLGGPESNPGGEENFRTCPDRLWGPTSLLYNAYRVLSGGKAAGAWRLTPTPSSAEVKERVELYSTLLLVFVACSSLNFTFYPYLIPRMNKSWVSSVMDLTFRRLMSTIVGVPHR